MSIIGFTGTQEGMTRHQQRSLESYLFSVRRMSTFIHGDCIGADEEAHTIARGLGFYIAIYPSDIEAKRAFCAGATVVEFPPKSPLQRNRNIVRSCHYLIACPKTPMEQLRSGTWATVRFADTIHKQTLLILPDGTMHKRHPEWEER